MGSGILAHNALRINLINMKQRKNILLLFLLAGILVIGAFASVSCGAKQVGFQSVMAALWLGEGDAYEISVVQARIPRTIFGMIAGAALAMSGGLMQSLTRNPIADPSILGVNTGASLFVVCGISYLHISSSAQYAGDGFLSILANRQRWRRYLVGYWAFVAVFAGGICVLSAAGAVAEHIGVGR